MTLEMPENNVFLSKEELDVAIAAIGNASRIPGMSDETYDLLTGVMLELRYAKRNAK